MVAALADLQHLPAWPRMLSAEQAAAYVGLSTASFDAAVRAGIYPPPVPLAAAGTVIRRRIWDRHAIDKALDDLSGITPPSRIDDAQATLRERIRGRKTQIRHQADQ